MPVSRRLRLALEFIAIYGGGPLLILTVRKPGILFAGLWIGALIAFNAVRDRKPEPHDVKHELRAILIRFAILAPLIVIATRILWPENFLSLPRQNPKFWALIMVLYPLLSVWPQEALYRTFLFTRYATLFNNNRRFQIAASAATFGFAHVIFLNWIAIAMTAIGGFLFARDYARHRSLFLTCVEHSLYGCLIFTAGLGRFFYTGAAWHHH